MWLLYQEVVSNWRVSGTEKGEGKLYRKATPEDWRKDPTPRQVEVIEIIAPLITEFCAQA